MIQMPFVFFVIFSAFSMNLVLQCGLGINGGAKTPGIKPVLIRLSIIFSVVIILWSVFTAVKSYIFSGIFIYVLLFPVSFMAYKGLEHLVFHNLLKIEKNDRILGFSGGITAAALFICMNISGNIIETIALSFGFTAGTLLVFLVLYEIQKRAALEAVPRFLRGKPLVLISMGLLSLVFSKASTLIFRMIGS